MKYKKLLIIGSFILITVLGIAYFNIKSDKPPAQVENNNTYIFQSNPNPDKNSEPAGTDEAAHKVHNYEGIGGSDPIAE